MIYVITIAICTVSTIGFSTTTESFHYDTDGNIKYYSIIKRLLGFSFWKPYDSTVQYSTVSHCGRKSSHIHTVGYTSSVNSRLNTLHNYTSLILHSISPPVCFITLSYLILSYLIYRHFILLSSHCRCILKRQAIQQD
jgi:hypothetical protein